MIIPKSALDPRLTLMDSAQAFHWNEGPAGWAAVADGALVTVEPCAEGWLAKSERGDAAAAAYLGLDRESASLSLPDESCPGALTARRATALLPGLRVLRQSAWETLLAFLCSENNHTSRIRSLALKLCDYGSARTWRGAPAYAYPSPEALARVSEEELRARRFGYRAAYIAGCARMVADGFPLNEASRLPYGEAKALLMRLPGVGGKVADCVLLFGCGHEEAFPVDVWVERLLGAWFGIEAPSREKAAVIARERFGPRAGIWQQYWFHCARTGLIPVDAAPNRRKEGE